MLFSEQYIFMNSAVNDWGLTRRLWFCLEDLPELPTALLASSHLAVYVAKKATLVAEVNNQTKHKLSLDRVGAPYPVESLEDANTCHYPDWLYSGKHTSCCLIGCFSRLASLSASRRHHFSADAGTRTVSNQWFLRHA
jgi:hypothetical protein